jgi:hypothetical protein
VVAGGTKTQFNATSDAGGAVLGLGDWVIGAAGFGPAWSGTLSGARVPILPPIWPPSKLEMEEGSSFRELTLDVFLGGEFWVPG